jgi:diguanylate cyclase (GGDEF)-like protein
MTSRKGKRVHKRPARIAKLRASPVTSRTAQTRKAPVMRELAPLLLEIDQLRRELAQARERTQSLEKLVDEDPLMPIANRRAFVRELTRMMAFAQRYGVAGSVVYIDLDNLKDINDTHGHAAGDAALLQVARLLAENVRASDVVGRLGGDELALLLVQTDDAAAEQKAALLARKIEDQPLIWRGRAVPLAISYGVHIFTGDENAEHVIAAADRAMYRRKQKALS